MTRTTSMFALLAAWLFLTTTATGQVCDPPLNLRCTQQDCTAGTVVIQWDAPLAGTVSSYAITRNGSPAGTVPGTGTQFTDTGVLQGVHLYEVTATCLVGTGGATVLVNFCSKVRLNEIRPDQPGGDIDEYFELTGPPGSSLDGLTYLAIGDGGGGSGTIEFVYDMTGNSLGVTGFFVAAESTFTLGIANATVSLNFENGDNVTHLLVSCFRGADGDDLDTNDDGVLDVAPWASIVDLVALIEEANPPAGTEYHYGPPTVGPDGAAAPQHAVRCPDGTGAWIIGPADPLVGVDTPGAPNICGLIDCNGNTVPDHLDILGGTSLDCNGNSVPDECDISGGASLDCNGNSIPDECDLTSGFSLDCNGNGIPDECDLTSGFSLDCQPNGIPDECDITTGGSLDCNLNSVPDECDLASGFSLDCQPNGVPDECDITAGTSLDCNGNSVPDECDIAGGFSLDCQPNGVPDDCDLASATSTDTNGNTIPDECEVVGQQFVRGNCNADANYDIADAVTALAFLFPTAPPPTPFLCDDACDCNDDGAIDIGDAVCILSGLFGAVAVPPFPPHPGCGLDPTPGDALGCGSFPNCP